MKFTRNLLFNSFHKDWYICESEKVIKRRTEIVLDFYNGEPDVLERCTFLLNPVPNFETKLKNCKDVIGPVEHPKINRQPLPHPPHLVPEKPSQPIVLPACMPVCPVGATGGAAVGPSTAGTSGVAIPSSTDVSSVSAANRRK